MSRDWWDFAADAGNFLSRLPLRSSSTHSRTERDPEILAGGESWAYWPVYVHEYLALATGTSAETVAKALTKLEELGFLAVDEGMVFRLYRLRDAQLRCFADKTTFSGTASADPDKLLDEFSPASEIFEKQQAERDRFVEWLNRWAIPNKAKDGIYKTVVRDPEWPERWQEKAESLVGRAMDPN